MNMVLHELKAYRKSTIIWTCTLVAVVVLLLSMFPTFARDADQFKSLLKTMPEAVLKAVGVQIETITTILGFYAYVFMYISLCGAIQAMNLGTSILSKEMREKTADFLLTKPVTRTQIVTSKLLAALISLLITNVIYLAAATIMAMVVKNGDFEMSKLMMISVTLFFIQLIFMALGFFVSVLVLKIKSVLPISLGTVFAFFIIGMLGATTGDGTIRYFTPFKYFDPAYIMQHASYEGPFLWLGLGIVVAAIAISYVVYRKRDIHAV
ncbi:ABC transporter permease subunit [Paenibacillus sp. GCM10027629]|uniref:ABC transporter permease subunit n=1 Tax=Paenibacillus sp. GCM10027629 TaxID=3273414 RepID=UPI003628A013